MCDQCKQTETKEVVIDGITYQVRIFSPHAAARLHVPLLFHPRPGWKPDLEWRDEHDFGGSRYSR